MKSVTLYSLFLVCMSGCSSNTDKLIKISGEAQGTTYHISLLADGKTDYKPAIDSIFKKIDSSLSSYLHGSIISRINRNENNVLLDDHFIKVFNKSAEIAVKTSGVFDVTVAPIINAWGFGFSKKVKVDSSMIKYLLQFIGYKMVSVQGNKLVKEKPEIELDFNGIAQGYTVDVIAAYLDSKDLESYIVELGGEVIAKGEKASHEYWKIGIDKPNEDPLDKREIKSILKLYNHSLATSGNYRKFYEEDGQKYSHIIDPSTGYPAKNNLLSASVITNDCMTADAYATVFMVMGLEKSLQFLEDNKELNLGVFFIFNENGVMKTYVSEALNKWMEVLD